MGNDCLSIDINDIKKPDQKVFDTFFNFYMDRIYSYAYSKIGNHPDTEDVVEGIFEKIIHSLDEALNISDLDVWVFKITSRYIHRKLNL